MFNMLKDLFTTYWDQSKTIFGALLAFVAYFIYQEYSYNKKKMEVRYSLWFKTKLENFIKFNSEYLTVSTALIRFFARTTNDEYEVKKMVEQLFYFIVNSSALSIFLSKEEVNIYNLLIDKLREVTSFISDNLMEKSMNSPNKFKGYFFKEMKTIEKYYIILKTYNEDQFLPSYSRGTLRGKWEKLLGKIRRILKS